MTDALRLTRAFIERSDLTRFELVVGVTRRDVRKDDVLAELDRLIKQSECVCGHSLDAHDGECQGDKIVAPGSFVPCECDAFIPAWAHWQDRAVAAEADLARWLEWSGGQYPDDSPGDVLAVDPDGTIVLDDSITTWNPLRALAFVFKQLRLMDYLLTTVEGDEVPVGAAPKRHVRNVVRSLLPSASNPKWASEDELGERRDLEAAAPRLPSPGESSHDFVRSLLFGATVKSVVHTIDGGKVDTLELEIVKQNLKATVRLRAEDMEMTVPMWMTEATE